MHSTNYVNTFIEVAEDCPVQVAQEPPDKETGKTIARLHYELIVNAPYTHTSDDVVFGTHALRNQISESQLKAEREKFFSKGQPCLRSSPLGKRYGWGVHSDAQGRVALVACESEQYRQFVADENLGHTRAMRSKRG